MDLEIRSLLSKVHHRSISAWLVCLPLGATLGAFKCWYPVRNKVEGFKGPMRHALERRFKWYNI